MLLETQRLIIRNFNETDIDALFKLKYDPQVIEYIPDFLERDIEKSKVKQYIQQFIEIENAKDNKAWRVYAIVNKESGNVMGSLSFGENEFLHEYELGWQMQEAYTKRGFASEAATAFSEYFCEHNSVDYLVVVMDVDNIASYKTAEKSGFKLFEKRIVYDYSYNRYGDEYYYFRRYYSKSELTMKYYGDVIYTGRHSDYEVR